MTASDLASALEGKREGREWRCRCPIHGGRSLSVTERDGRLLLVCRAGCSQADVIKALRDDGLWGGESDHGRIYSPPPPAPPDDREKRIGRAERIREESHEITPGDPVHQYLTGRGITLNTWPEDLHHHPALPYWTQDDNGKLVLLGKWPAMIAVVRDPPGRTVAIHRTYITSDGQKAPVEAPKKILQIHDLTGSAVRLFPPKDGVLGGCEGIEDALSAWILWQIPTWATLGTSGMRTFEPPEEIRELLIFADRDENGAGEKAAWELAERMETKEKAVRIRVPSGHKDLNALLMKGANK